MALNASNLDRLLANGALFAGRDDLLPMMMGVELSGTASTPLPDGEIPDGHVVSVATNRFALGVSHAPYKGPDFRVFISLPDVLLLRKILAAKRVGKMDATLVVGPTKVTVAAGGTSLTLTHNPDMAVPKWRHLLPQGEVESVSPVMHFDAKKLAVFAKVDGGRYADTVFRRGPEASSPMVVKVGEDFVGLIMPVRFGVSGTVPGWAL